MVRLRRVDCSRAGLRRVRSGRGFRYLDACGNPVEDPDVLNRIRALAVPPAWRDVWICPWPNGHIQATGVDAAGRRQYRYHDAWRARRDTEKFERMLAFGAALPGLRQQVAADLALDGYPRDRVLACAVRLLDLGFFRVGGEEYEQQHGTYGLATLHRRHVRLRGARMRFHYTAKGGIERVLEIEDSDAAQVLSGLKRRRGGGPELLAYRDGRRWVDVRSADVNDYLKQHAGPEFTAKDFRTWSATLLAAAALGAAARAPRSPTARKRAVAHAYREVAHYLGNTPTVCRTSYVDPRVVDCYRAGETVSSWLERWPEPPDDQDQTPGGPLSDLEAAVLRMLQRAPAIAA